MTLETASSHADAEQTEVLQRAQRRLASLHELIDDLLDSAPEGGLAGAAKRVDLRTVAARSPSA